MYVIVLQKEGQIPAILRFTQNGSEAVKTIRLSLRAIKIFHCPKFLSQCDIPLTLYFNKKTKDLLSVQIYKNLKHVMKFRINSSNKAEKQLVETITVIN